MMERNIVFTHTTNNSSSINQKSRDGGTIRFEGSTKGKSSDVFALAKAFLAISSMSHKKLQKLCYYAKAWYLAIYDRNLIDDQFQAWVHGAVQPALYVRYKQYGFGDIPQVTFVEDIPEEFRSFAQEIYESYGHLTGNELEKLNHQEEPWIKARGTRRPWENCNVVISEEDMKLFYRKMMI